MSSSPRLVTLGWMEWVALPELGIERIAAKLDTGAQTSSLHASQVLKLSSSPALLEFTAPLLRYQTDPDSWPAGGIRRVRAPSCEERIVRSSNGQERQRWVIRTRFLLGGLSFEAELGLTHRDGMSCPLLLGREALAGRFLVDASQKFIASSSPTPAEGPGSHCEDPL